MLSCTLMTMAMFRQTMASRQAAPRNRRRWPRHAGMPTEHWLRYRGLDAETAKLLRGLPPLDAGQLGWPEEVPGANLQAPGVSVGVRRGGGCTDGDP